MRLGEDCRLRHGIYAVRMRRADGSVLDGVASYGRRPTFDNGAPVLEVFAFDFSGDLYGEEVVVTFFDWIRAGGAIRRHRGADRGDEPRLRDGARAAGCGRPRHSP